MVDKNFLSPGVWYVGKGLRTWNDSEIDAAVGPTRALAKYLLHTVSLIFGCRRDGGTNENNLLLQASQRAPVSQRHEWIMSGLCFCTPPPSVPTNVRIIPLWHVCLTNYAQAM